jgi:hypothetical protein
VSKLVPLDIWAARRYGEKPPSIHTLRRWVREAKIVPVPKKNGRSYYVSENARYIDYNDPDYANAIAEALSESAPAQHG